MGPSVRMPFGLSELVSLRPNSEPHSCDLHCLDDGLFAALTPLVLAAGVVVLGFATRIVSNPMRVPMVASVCHGWCATGEGRHVVDLAAMA